MMVGRVFWGVFVEGQTYPRLDRGGAGWQKTAVGTLVFVCTREKLVRAYDLYSVLDPMFLSSVSKSPHFSSVPELLVSLICTGALASDIGTGALLSLVCAGPEPAHVLSAPELSHLSSLLEPLSLLPNRIPLVSRLRKLSFLSSLLEHLFVSSVPALSSLSSVPALP